MHSIDVGVLLKHLVKLHNHLCATKAKSRNKIITALLEKDCNHLYRLIATLSPMLEVAASIPMTWGPHEAAQIAAEVEAAISSEDLGV